MNEIQMVLQILQEECGEVIQAASKINRFGLDGSYPNGIGNVEQLDIEFNDAITLITIVKTMLEHKGYKFPSLANEKAMKAKIDRVMKSLEDSKARGCLVNV